MNGRPVFIAGLERSGTTLLYSLLASHPNIAMTRRTNFWKFFFNRFGDLNRPENFDRCITAMMQYERLAVLNTDWERLRRDFQQGEPTYAELFALLEGQHASLLGKPRWGDKSLRTERYAEIIFHSYPAARIVHIIRDPRDRYASACKQNRIGRGKAASGIAAWLWSARLARQNLIKYPHAYHVVRFESLASQPEDTLKDICRFIGEEYTPAMLTMEGTPAYRDKGGNSSFEKHRPGSISTAPVGRFRKVLSPRDVAFIQAFARREMTAFDYEMEPIHLGLRERLAHSIVDWPMNLAYVAAWHALDAYKSRTTLQPSARRLVQSVS